MQQVSAAAKLPIDDREFSDKRRQTMPANVDQMALHASRQLNLTG
jgi:hypothetical protein